MTAIEMRINGYPMPAPKVEGITVKEEKIWSKNTGRTASGRMIGTIIAIKTTMSISWPPLTQPVLEYIRHFLSNLESPFVTLELTEPDGTQWAMECYMGTPSYTLWDWMGGEWRCTNVKVDAIER